MKAFIISTVCVITLLLALIVYWLVLPVSGAPTQIQPLPINPSTNQTYTVPPWKYVHKCVDRSYGRLGLLYFNHRDLGLQPLGTNDYYKTPWGEMYWHGTPGIRYLPTGWMPFPTWRHGAGKLLPTPGVVL